MKIAIMFLLLLPMLAHSSTDFDQIKKDTIRELDLVKTNWSRLIKYAETDRQVCYLAGETNAHSRHALWNPPVPILNRIRKLDLLSEKLLDDVKAGKVDVDQALQQQQAFEAEAKQLKTLLQELHKIIFSDVVVSDFCLTNHPDVTIQDVKDEAAANINAAQAFLDIFPDEEK